MYHSTTSSAIRLLICALSNEISPLITLTRSHVIRLSRRRFRLNRHSRTLMSKTVKSQVPNARNVRNMSYHPSQIWRGISWAACIRIRSACRSPSSTVPLLFQMAENATFCYKPRLPHSLMITPLWQTIHASLSMLSTAKSKSMRARRWHPGRRSLYPLPMLARRVR